jgi:hypothetical protein
MHLTRESLEFLARFAKSPEGIRFKAVLEGKLADVSKDLRSLAGEQIYRAQGKALMLDELLADLNDAQTRLNRSTPARSQGQR